MSRLILVRHGETVWHEDNRYAGRSDIALTGNGLEQARCLGMWAAKAGLAAVWSSPLQRAVRTAEFAAAAGGLPLQIDSRLSELDFGRGEGLTDAEMMAAFPKERAAFAEAPATNYLPGGEDPAHAAARGLSALRKIAENPGRSLVIAHNTLLRLMLCAALGIPLDRYRRLFPTLSNGTLTEVELMANGEVALLMFNVPLDNAG